MPLAYVLVGGPVGVEGWISPGSLVDTMNKNIRVLDGHGSSRIEILYVQRQKSNAVSFREIHQGVRLANWIAGSA
jgi:hypothetical protein